MIRRTRYALCGLSVRALYHFLLPLLGRATGPGANDFSAESEVVGILDIDGDRVRAFNERLGLDIPFFDAAGGVERFIEETRPDTLLVAGPDHTHEEHIVAGLRAGLRVIAEKPAVISCAQMRNVLEAEKNSRGRLVVAHNGRYNPQLGAVKEAVLRGEIGRITNVEYVYNLDTFHGPSYFYRWNRERAKSGGLSVHKGVHHFDILSWLLGAPPETVFGFGALNYFGPEGAHNPARGADRALTLTEVRERCPYFAKHYRRRLDPAAGRPNTGWDALQLPYKAQYPGDAYIYDAEIDIEDTYSAVIAFHGGASATYSCNFSAPYEGYRLAINGTAGRIEAERRIHPDPTGRTQAEETEDTIRILPLFGEPRTVKIPRPRGGHGGSDPVIQRDLFTGVSEHSRRLGLVADSYAGALAVGVGEGLWRSIKENRPFTLRELLGPWYRPPGTSARSDS
jgi:Predicted dehydrogenases and related proteins